MSEKSRYLPPGTQTGPSAHSNLFASSSSSFVAGAISLSKAGSRRSMVPSVGNASSAPAVESSPSAAVTASMGRELERDLGGISSIVARPSGRRDQLHL